MNCVQLLGRLGADPESRTSNNGTEITNLRIATSRKYKGEEETQWHRVVCFGKTAEIAAKYLQKGRLVAIIGRIEYSEWTDKEGNKRWSTDIICNNLELVADGSGRGGNSGGGGGGGGRGGGYSGGYGGGTPNDDVPFVTSLDEADAWRVLS